MFDVLDARLGLAAEKKEDSVTGRAVLSTAATKRLTAKAPGPRSKSGISTRVRAVVTAEPRNPKLPHARGKAKFLYRLISAPGLAAPNASRNRGAALPVQERFSEGSTLNNTRLAISSVIGWL